MRAIDPGHGYDLQRYDGEGVECLWFLKREGDGFPGNVGHYAGTNCQEVLRALIDRVKYLDNQVQCSENARILWNLRIALVLFEKRAAQRHGLELNVDRLDVENIPACATCGHVVCEHGLHS